MFIFGRQTVMKMSNRIHNSFFHHDVLTVAPGLLGKLVVRRFDSGRTESFIITEVEAYRGGEDKACHANKGKTPRTEVMFREGGVVYVYLVYGIHWMLNIVTGPEGDSSAVLIRGVKGINGPGRVGKTLQLDKSFYGENLAESNRIWIENPDTPLKTLVDYTTMPRVGIDYAGEPWVSKPWRYLLQT